MASCWEVLEISPTSDIDVIKKARRLLIKRYHPDTVSNPQQKEQYTNRCVEINEAYDEAMKLAEVRAWILSRAPVSETKKPQSRRSHVAPSWELLLSIGLMGLLVLGIAFRRHLASIISVAVFAAGLGVMWCLDLLLYVLALKPLLSSSFFRRHGIEKHRQAVACSLLMIYNGAILEFLNSVAGRYVFGGIGGLIFYATAILALPLWLYFRIGSERRPKSEFQTGDAAF